MIQLVSVAQSLAVLLNLGIAGELRPRPVDAEDAWEHKPKLIAKTKGVLVHAIPFPDSAGMRGAAYEAGGVLLVHTEMETGTMTRMLTSGTAVHPTRRMKWSHTRVVGVAVSGEHLYVQLWRIGGWDRVPPRHDMRAEGAVYAVDVFDLSTGGRVSHTPLDLKPDPDAKPPEETLETGALEVIEGGVKIGDIEIKTRRNRQRPPS